MVLPAWLGHSTALAAAAPNASAVDGQPLFEQGKQAAREKQWHKALDLFRRAYEAQPSYDVAANLGHVALKLNEHAEAARYLWISLQGFPPSETTDRRESIEALYHTAKQGCAMVSPTVVPESADLLIDGALLRRSPGEPVFLDPGKYFITAEAEGHEPVNQLLQAVAGGELAVTFELPKTPRAGKAPVSTTTPEKARPATTPSPAPARPRALPVSPMVQGASLHLGLLVGGGATAAALAVGVGYALSAREARQDAERLVRQVGGPSGCFEPSSNSVDCARLSDTAESVDRKRAISYVGYGIAGAAALGTVTYLFWPGLGRSLSPSGELEPSVRIGAGSAEFTAYF